MNGSHLLKEKDKKKRRKKSPQTRLEEKLWNLCKLIIRKKYPNNCYTCPATGLEGCNWQTGHMWPKGSLGSLLKYEIALLRPQCYNCNINYGGQGAIFYARMLRELGKKEMSHWETVKIMDKKGQVKAMDHYQKLLVDYKQVYESLTRI